ncbi:MAG: helix-turn-helix domain-containing protein [Propionibacteriaceae bacterium]|jgi:excisionase family DNA binding protein|nr:helix-turn-helix domain-containing protein [Propionibacteriaceae bacterium]
MSVSGLTVSPEMVRINGAHDSDCAKAVCDFIRHQSDGGKTVQVTAREVACSPAEVADLVGLSRSTVQRRIADQTIQAVRRGSRWRVFEAQVDRYRLSLADEMAALVADDLDL